VQLDDRSVEIMALAPILERTYGQGRHDPVPDQLMAAVRLYNAIPAGDEPLWERAVAAAWRDYCAGKETDRGA
jgi:hypothetical protein